MSQQKTELVPRLGLGLSITHLVEICIKSYLTHGLEPQFIRHDKAEAEMTVFGL